MHTVILVLVEVLITIGVSRVLGWSFRAIRQPLVIGEIVAGIALGPSLLGWLVPGVAAWLFPAAALPHLNVLSQVGLIFFMFLIGLELDPKYLQGNLKIAVVTSGVSIIVPFTLAGLLAAVIYPIVSSSTVSFTAFALFLGVAMSITAFPVLARIITENNLQNTRLGTLALTCAAVDDVTAWCLLAITIAVTRTNSIVGAIPTIIYALIYIVGILTIGSWLLQALSTHYDRTGKVTQLLLAGIYMGVVGSALITETIGIHLIFGAFLLGAAMPKNPGLVREIAEKTEDFVLIFLLPVFFAYSGLKTQVGLLNSPRLWLLCLGILIVAIVGKYVGTYYTARRFQIDRREASALGWLMNTRGLTELIVLNIGLELGVISPLLFTMLVIMALVTTFMTSPLLEWTYPKHLIRLTADTTPPPPDRSHPSPPNYRILVPVANPHTQKQLLQLAIAIGHNPKQSAIVNPLSLIELEEDYLFQSTPVEANRLIQQQVAKLNNLISTLEPQPMQALVKPLVQIGYDVAEKTATIAQIEHPDLILLGGHRPTLSNNRLGGRVSQILSIAPTDVGVLIDDITTERLTKGFDRLLVAYTGDRHDDLALEIALRMLMNEAQRSLELVYIYPSSASNGEIGGELDPYLDRLSPEIFQRVNISALDPDDPVATIVELSRAVDLTIAGIGRSWGIKKATLGRYIDRLTLDCASPLLITRRYSQFSSHLAMTEIPDPVARN
jgi:Kef-type K+ transport system membrane component KefB